MNKKPLLIAALGTAGTLAAAAPILGQHGTPGATGGTEVAITETTYVPGDVVVGPGQHVMFRNTGTQVHTVTSKTAGQFDSGNLLPKATYNLVAPATPGTYAFTCIYHAYMNGNVVVTTLTMSGPASVRAGSKTTLKGAVPGGAAGTPVSVEAGSGAAWRAVGSTTLGADGSFTMTTAALRATTTFRAHVGADVSPSVTVAVGPTVKLSKKKGALVVKVTPKKAGKANLEKLNLNNYRWSRVKALRIPASGTVTVKVKAPGKYRVTVLPTKTVAMGRSATVTVR